MNPAPIPAVVPTPVYERIKFSTAERFVNELKRRIDGYFEETGKPRRDCWQMYLKTFCVFAWFFGTWAALVFIPMAWYFVLPIAVLMGLSVAAIGFNVQHDGGHKAYSDKPWVNKLMALSLDLMGGSSYFWDWKHNTIHHTYANIHGHDDDIEIGILGRLSPQQPRYKFHRFQNVYLWFLYGFIAIKWHLVDDFVQLFKGKIGAQRVPRPKGRDLFVFFAGKFTFFSLAFFIPMMFHAWYAVIGIYFLAAFVSGVTMAVVFQLAHVVEEAEYPDPIEQPDGTGKMETSWYLHQLMTTVDFARNSRIACWFLGGLNFQVEHHLFSKICHIHYPALSKVVEDTCREFGIQYNAHKSFVSAVASHYRWIAVLGKQDVVTH